MGSRGDVDIEFIEARSEWSGQGSSVSASGRQRSRAATWRSSPSCSVIRSCRSSLEAASRVTAAAKTSQGTSSRSGPSRRTSMTATSVGVRSRMRRSTDRDTNRVAAGAVGVRPATAIVSTAGTCVVKPRCAAADKRAGPAPGPATASAISSGRGSGIPRRVRGPFQYRPLRTRMTSPELARRDSSHSTARRDPATSPVEMNDRVGAASTCSRTSCAALMRAKCNEKLSECLRQSVFGRWLDGWAETVGFEPTNDLHRYFLSREAPSTGLGHVSGRPERTGVPAMSSPRRPRRPRRCRPGTR